MNGEVIVLYNAFLGEELTLNKASKAIKNKAAIIFDKLTDQFEIMHTNLVDINPANASRAGVPLLKINRLISQLADIKIELDPFNKFDIDEMEDLIDSTTKLASLMGMEIINNMPKARPDLKRALDKAIYALQNNSDSSAARSFSLTTLMQLDKESKKGKSPEIEIYKEKLSAEIEYFMNRHAKHEPLDVEMDPIPQAVERAAPLQFNKVDYAPGKVKAAASGIRAQINAREAAEKQQAEVIRLQAIIAEAEILRNNGLNLIAETNNTLESFSASGAEKTFLSNFKTLLHSWAEKLQATQDPNELNKLNNIILQQINAVSEIQKVSQKAASTLVTMKSDQRLGEIDKIYDKLNQVLSTHKQNSEVPALFLSDLQTSTDELSTFNKSLPLNITSLTKVGKKPDGKNVSEVNGSYLDADANKHFIKKPDDPNEFFTELFAGVLMTGLMEQNFIPKDYKDTFVPARQVLLEDGTFGLIQPFLEFTPLHMLIGNSKDGQKFVLGEVTKKQVLGQGYEGIVQEGTELHGLSFALMIKLFMADYSIHDGNIGVVKSTIGEGLEQKELLSFIAFDFGAALRAISSTDKEDNIYTSLEEKNRSFNFYKKYPTLYANMPDVFVNLAKHAENLENSIQNRGREFYKIVLDAVNRSFDSFKANFGQDKVAWEKNRVKLLNYMYKGDANLPNLLSLNDEEFKTKLAADLRTVFVGRLQRLSVEAAPEPLNKSRIKRYGSFSGPSGEEGFDLAGRSRPSSVDKQTANIFRALQPGSASPLALLQSKQVEGNIAAVAAYKPPTVTFAEPKERKDNEMRPSVGPTLNN